MKIIKTPSYVKDFNKKIINKHLEKEKLTIDKIEKLLINSLNLKELMLNPLHIIYGIEKKCGNLKKIYTAKVNEKLRIYIIPNGEYPYELSNIIEIELSKIDDKHYGEG
ncbi:MAG: hypothetical protein RSC09_06655 [Clostridia bacterium]